MFDFWKKRVFVSFDYTLDKHYKFLLDAWCANDKFSVDYVDVSSREIQSWDVGTLKQVISRKINEATHTLVLIGRDAAKRHPNASSIGHMNWQSYEIAKSLELGKRLIAVKLDRSNIAPPELYGAQASWAFSFTQAAIEKAVDDA